MFEKPIEKIYAPETISIKFFVDAKKRLKLFREYRKKTWQNRTRFDSTVYAYGLTAMEEELLNSRKA